MNPPNDPLLIVCYPGGSGGSFLSTALHSVYHDLPFFVDPDLGHCHHSSHARFPNIFHGPTIQSLQQEIDNIQKVDFSCASLYSGHYRNLVAIQQAIETQLGYEFSSITKFVTISVDHWNKNEIFFIATMLKHKTNCFPGLSFDDFPEQTSYYIKSWYWVENFYTAINTTSLSLQDIFSPGLENRLSGVLTETQANIFKKHHLDYLDMQEKLYPDLFALI